MSEPYILDWNGQHLVPATSYDLERMQRFKPGEQLKADRLVRPRSLPMQRKYWVCLKRFVDATECAPTEKHLHDVIKLETGYTTRIRLPNGVFYDIADSTAFDEMSQDEFQEYVKTADRWCLETFGAPLMQDEREG